MAARVVMLNTETGERKSMYTVDAKELLKGQDEKIRKARDEGKEMAREWVPDSRSKPAPPPTEDERILQRLEERERERERAREEADELARVEREEREREAREAAEAVAAEKDEGDEPETEAQPEAEKDPLS